MSYEEFEYYYCKYNNYKSQLGYINSNEESDLYCYVILFLNYLYGSNVGSFSLEEYYDYIDYLETLGYDKNLIQAFIKIITNAPNENIEEYLDTLSDEQVYRAHKYVYKAVKNNR